MEASEDSFETITVFGLLKFGSQALEWSDETFYYRTGIALKFWKENKLI
jgi:hypothetical protein